MTVALRLYAKQKHLQEDVSFLLYCRESTLSSLDYNFNILQVIFFSLLLKLSKSVLRSDLLSNMATWNYYTVPDYQQRASYLNIAPLC